MECHGPAECEHRPSEAEEVGMDVAEPPVADQHTTAPARRGERLFDDPATAIPWQVPSALEGRIRRIPQPDSADHSLGEQDHVRMGSDPCVFVADGSHVIGLPDGRACGFERALRIVRTERLRTTCASLRALVLRDESCWRFGPLTRAGGVWLHSGVVACRCGVSAIPGECPGARATSAGPAERGRHRRLLRRSCSPPT